LGPRLLVATVRELLREVAASPPEPARSLTLTSAGDLLLDGARRVAVVAGREVALTGTEFGILAALATSPGRVLSRRQLLAAAGRTSEERAADVYIVQLRAKIGVPGLIRTIRGAGYAMEQPASPAVPELGGGHPPGLT
jgi:DNA-binding response OmpR family regulator